MVKYLISYVMVAAGLLVNFQQPVQEPQQTTQGLQYVYMQQPEKIDFIVDAETTKAELSSATNGIGNIVEIKPALFVSESEKAEKTTEPQVTEVKLQAAGTAPLPPASQYSPNVAPVNPQTQQQANTNTGNTVAASAGSYYGSYSNGNSAGAYGSYYSSGSNGAYAAGPVAYRGNGSAGSYSGSYSGYSGSAGDYAGHSSYSSGRAGPVRRLLGFERRQARRANRRAGRQASYASYGHGSYAPQYANRNDLVFDSSGRCLNCY